jgi:phosphotransferase system enzyme I (PtsI)
VFAGFVTDVGGKTSHTAIVARSMDIPAVVGARNASQLVRQDDWVIIDGDAGVVIVDPSAIILAEYGFKQRQGEWNAGACRDCGTRPPSRWTGRVWSCWPTSRCLKTRWLRWRPAQWAWACSAASSSSWGATASCPTRKSSTRLTGAPSKACRACPSPSAPWTSVPTSHWTAHASRKMAYLNPALGLRAIRWSLSDPGMFLTQLRAILRAATLSAGRICSCPCWRTMQ